MQIGPEVYFTEEEIKSKIKELGKQITKDYDGDELVVICVLNGSFIFCSDLIRKINLPVRLEFIQVSSYGVGTKSSGECQLKLDLTGSITGKNVLIVEDIVDTGNTIKFLLELMNVRHPKSLKLASLLHKPSKNIHPVTIDYLGFEIEDKFVVGYGLDYAGHYRELPYVGILNANN